jgi:CheY-like chemotaxis protein
MLRLFGGRIRVGGGIMPDRRIIKVLLLEDDPADKELIREFLSEEQHVQISLTHADRLSSAISLLEKEEFDVILSDLSLPDSRGLETFDNIHNRFPDIPIIVLTGLDDKATALDAVSRGAQDYIYKGQITHGHLLSRAILYAIERHKLLLELDRKIKEIKTLRGIIPICAWCRKIRNEEGYWLKVEEYLEEHSDAAFSHGMCEECGKKAYSELEELKKTKPDPQKIKGSE